jgi:trans-aconitate 2-methyltransferase
MAIKQVLGTGSVATQARSELWDAAAYDWRHALVWKSASGILGWLAPQADEAILDIACGTSHVAAHIAQAGADVVGMDS